MGLRVYLGFFSAGCSSFDPPLTVPEIRSQIFLKQGCWEDLSWFIWSRGSGPAGTMMAAIAIGRETEALAPRVEQRLCVPTAQGWHTVGLERQYGRFRAGMR